MMDAPTPRTATELAAAVFGGRTSTAREGDVRDVGGPGPPNVDGNFFFVRSIDETQGRS